MLDEKQLSTALYAHIKAGATRRREGGTNPHGGNTVAHMLESVGWVQEDLRLALKEASPRYRAQQESFGQ